MNQAYQYKLLKFQILKQYFDGRFRKLTVTDGIDHINKRDLKTVYFLNPDWNLLYYSILYKHKTTL